MDKVSGGGRPSNGGRGDVSDGDFGGEMPGRGQYARFSAAAGVRENDVGAIGAVARTMTNASSARSICRPLESIEYSSNSLFHVGDSTVRLCTVPSALTSPRPTVA